MKTQLCLIALNLCLVAVGSFGAGYNYRADKDRTASERRDKILCAAIAEVYGAQNKNLARVLFRQTRRTNFDDFNEWELRRKVRTFLDDTEENGHE